MATVFNLYDAKTRLSELVDRAAGGEEIIIAKSGKALARLVPLAAQRAPRAPGVWKDKLWIADDLDAPLPADVQRYFDGDDDEDYT